MIRQTFRPLAIALAALTIPAVAIAGPPDHAPAHGYRAKKQPAPEHGRTHSHGGFELVIDPERGISVAVGFPGVYFHSGAFYRRHDGHWQVSHRADRGWKAVEVGSAPEVVRKAHSHHPGPAKPKKGRR